MGVTSLPASGEASKAHKALRSKKGDEKTGWNIDSEVFLRILYRTLKTKSNDACLDDIAASNNENVNSVDDKTLLQYFSKEDIAFEEMDEMDPCVNGNGHNGDGGASNALDDVMVSARIEKIWCSGCPKIIYSAGLG